MDKTDNGKDQVSTLAAGRRQSPKQLVLVRHGESIGNIAGEAARKQELDRLDLETRDPDTPLSADGVAQAKALGEHLRTMPADERPDIILASPYVRARTTAETALEHAGLKHRLVLDERLREREFGAFDRLTRRGIMNQYPDEAARLEDLGKFYFRPPGGESWTDVALRVRSILADIRAEYDNANVWVFSHQAVVMVFRYVLELLDESTVLGINSTDPLPNCSMTSYVASEEGSLELHRYGFTGHIDASPAPVTREEPAAGGPS